MAVQQRRVSKTRKRMRLTHIKKEAPTLTTCSKCGANLKPHRACTKCGNYKGENVLGATKEENVA